MKNENETPKCDKCGAEITTSLMAVYCPYREKCELWPDPGSDGEKFILEMRGENEKET